MKFVVLVSGGKDSCFNILHCLAQGHELVCLANLYPAEPDNDEIDSYMYQTVGHDVLTLYEKCTGKPMYREPILGNASNQKLEYKKTENDETEDLYRLLDKVVKKHPDVEGVSVGAILSSYQRTRVEDVCSRLGLTSLAYLWQRDQGELMNEMCSSGMDARIIKVAAIGLNDSNLGMSLQEIHPTLLQLNKMFGVHICGEGGEFETSVLDAPFFKYGRIVITEKSIVKHTNDEVWYLKMKVGFEPKDVSDDPIDWKKHVVVPPLLNETFHEIYESGKIRDEYSVAKVNINEKYWKFNVYETDDKLYISNITSVEESIEGQVADIFKQLSGTLNQFELDFENIQSAKLLLQDMSNFVTINSIYVKYFTKPLPPARICVETMLPNNTHAQLSVVVLKELDAKVGLHVQGISYWAPCNIGPYSQAISSRNDQIVRISGQIPLIPMNMTLPTPKDDRLSSTLSLKHYHSIKEVTNYKNNLLTICFIKDCNLVSMVQEQFREYISLCEDEGYTGTENLVVVQVTELPKGSDVEWGGLSYREECESLNYDSDSLSEDENENESKDAKDKVKVSYVDKLSEYSTFKDNRFYEIYGDVLQIDAEMPQHCEVFPAVAVYGASGHKSLAIVESTV